MIDPELRARVTRDAPAITGRPADLLPPELERATTEVRRLVPAADTAEVLSYALFPAIYKSYRSAVDSGLTADVLTTAALGVVAALRAEPAPAVRAGPSWERAGPSPWAHEGRVRSHAQGGAVRAAHGRARR